MLHTFHSLAAHKWELEEEPCHFRHLRVRFLHCDVSHNYLVLLLYAYLMMLLVVYVYEMSKQELWTNSYVFVVDIGICHL